MNTEMKPAEDDTGKPDGMAADHAAKLKEALDAKIAKSQEDALKITAHLHQRLGEAFNAGDHIAKYFGFAHLPPKLQPISMSFASLAVGLIDNLPRNPERTVALRKLLEAKDAAVRAALP